MDYCAGSEKYVGPKAHRFLLLNPQTNTEVTLCDPGYSQLPNTENGNWNKSVNKALSVRGLACSQTLPSRKFQRRHWGEWGWHLYESFVNEWSRRSAESRKRSLEHRDNLRKTPAIKVQHGLDSIASSKVHIILLSWSYSEVPTIG